jgi:hypothetical protein
MWLVGSDRNERVKRLELGRAEFHPKKEGCFAFILAESGVEF